MILELTEKIGVGYLAFDSNTPPYSGKKKKNSPEIPSYHITRRGRYTTIKIYLSPYYTSTLCGGITEGLNGGKL